MVSCGSRDIPQRLKPRYLWAYNGTTKVVPLQSGIHATSSRQLERALRACETFEFDAKPVIDFCDKIEHRPGQSRIHADPEHVVHHEIRIGQIVDRAILTTFVGRLAEDVPSEKKSRVDLLRFKSAR